MTIQELKPILITLLGESSRISWNEATDQAAAAIMELVDKEKIELFKSEIERLQKQKRSLEVLHANSSDVTLLTSRRLGGKMEGIELALENLRQTIQQFSQSKTAKND